MNSTTKVAAPAHNLIANSIRGLAMDGVQRANSGHPGMPMGMADVAAVLWTRFLKFNAAVMIGKCHLGIHHPEFGQMPPRLRFLSAKGRPERVDLPHRHRHGLTVQLTALCQVGRPSEVVDLEQCGRALHRVARQDGRIHLDESALLEELVHREYDAIPDPHDRPLPSRPEPQMAVIHQELDAVILGRDREIGRAHV